MSKEVCYSRRKKQYETLFEAEVAVAHAEQEFNLPFEYYECGRHYHVANSLPEFRSKNRVVSRTLHPDYCKPCDKVIQRDQIYTHRDTKKHRTNVRKQLSPYPQEKETIE